MTPRGVVVLVAAIAAAALTARLGVWQLDRAAQKTSLQQAIESRAAQPALDAAALARTAAEAAAQHHRPVRLAGRWDAGRTVFLDNRQMDGRPGFFVVTPLVIGAEGDAVLVQRGWVPRDPRDRARLPPVATPEGMVVVDGRIAPPPARLLELAGEGGGPIRQNLDLDALSRETGLTLRPLSVIQLGGASDGLERRWSAPAAGVHKHYGYAFQWFALSALIAVLYVWFQLVRPRLQRRR
jgi:surfeit locus 1 family protein